MRCKESRSLSLSSVECNERAGFRIDDVLKIFRYFIQKQNINRTHTDSSYYTNINNTIILNLYGGGYANPPFQCFTDSAFIFDNQFNISSIFLRNSKMSNYWDEKFFFILKKFLDHECNLPIQYVLCKNIRKMKVSLQKKI